MLSYDKGFSFILHHFALSFSPIVIISFIEFSYLETFAFIVAVGCYIYLNSCEWYEIPVHPFPCITDVPPIILTVCFHFKYLIKLSLLSMIQ